MDRNNFFYFYSTVAQTLAGVIGVLAVFLIFYLQRIDFALQIIQDRLAPAANFFGVKIAPGFLKELRKHIENRGKEGFLGDMTKETIDTAQKFFKSYDIIIKEKNSLFKKVIDTVITSFLCVGLSVVGICFVSQEPGNLQKIYLAVVVILFFWVLCLVGIFVGGTPRVLKSIDDM